MIIKDELLLNEFRAKTFCEWCKRYCPGQLDAHHVFLRGIGGGKRLDIRINLVSLDRWCHGDYHDGRITRDDLLALVAHRERTTPEEITAEVYRLQRAPKVPVARKRRKRRVKR